MKKIAIVPLSINRCWQGRRFKTKEYSEYEEEVLMLLPKMKIPEGNLAVKIRLGFSSKASDLDNPIKPILDILQKGYGFNDKKIYKLEVEKIDVEKGSEFFEFTITPYVTIFAHQKQ